MTDKQWKKHEKKLLKILSRWNNIYDNLIGLVKLKDERIQMLADQVQDQARVIESKERDISTFKNLLKSNNEILENLEKIIEENDATIKNLEKRLRVE